MFKVNEMTLTTNINKMEQNLITIYQRNFN